MALIFGLTAPASGDRCFQKLLGHHLLVPHEVQPIRAHRASHLVERQNNLPLESSAARPAFTDAGHQHSPTRVLSPILRSNLRGPVVQSGRS